MYHYRASLKSDVSDELINTWLLRPIAGLLIWPLYYTPVTPNMVTIASTVAGLAAAVLYLLGPAYFAVAGLMITLKDLLDSADGQLARAKNQYSRIGRFLDSIGDIVVNVFVFGAIGYITTRLYHDPLFGLLSGLGLAGISLRVSYHVFYQSHYLHSLETYANNRIEETITEEDLQRGGGELLLQRIFVWCYGWQDRWMVRIDRWSRKERSSSAFLQRWYGDPSALRLSGFLGFGTELFLLMICSVLGKLDLYLILNLFLMNGIWAAAILYRRLRLLSRLAFHVTD